MEAPEIILNLWYVYDDQGTIYSLRGRCYIGSGSDEEKLAFLSRFAATDYLIAQPFPVPERLHTTFIGEKGTQKLPVIGTGPIERMGGPEVLFEEVFVELEKQLPTQTGLSIGSEPLICITPLLGSEDGNLRPITSPSSRLRSRRNGKE